MRRLDMNRILIVDDEPIIADGLFDEFQNITYLELDIYKAYSGKEALDILNKIRIDIVITDIRMPGVDGMELMKRIRANWPECKVIFLTGYKEFNYAYNAIQHSGVKYILKTEGYGKIIETVEKTISEIEEDLKSGDLLKMATQQLGTLSLMLQKEFLTALITGEDVSQNLKQEELEKLGIPLKEDFEVLMLIGRVDLLPKTMTFSEKTKYFYTIKLIVEKFLSFKVDCIQIIDNHYNLVWLMQPKYEISMDNDSIDNLTALWNSTILFIKGTLETIQITCRETLGMTISFAYNNQSVCWENIADNYDSLRLTMDYRISSGVEMLLMDTSILKCKSLKKPIYEETNLKFNSSKLEILETYLERCKKDEFINLLKETTNFLPTIKSRHYAPALKLYFSISMLFLTYINRWNLEDEIPFKTPIYKLLRPDEHASWADAVEYLVQLAGIIFEIQEGEEDKRVVDISIALKTYINNHLDEEITLTKLADIAYFNPSYLSRLFKHMTGINLTEYIQDARIKKAKLLLKNNDYKICDVAKAVGYGSATNFTRFYKKVTNITPQEYRELRGFSDI
jgi:two-component system response regulator YesN